MSNAALRVFTAVVGIPVVIGCAYVGGWTFAVVAAACGIVAQLELYGLARARGIEPFVVAGAAVGVLVALRTMIEWFLPIAVLAVCLVVVLLPFVSRGGKPLEELAVTILGVIYPTALLTFLVDLRIGRGLGISEIEAFWLTMLVLILVWTADTGAYVAGRWLGKRALAPSISPGKTWEGAIGGALLTFVVGFTLRAVLLDWISALDMLALCAIAGVIAPLGDLAESILKRSAGAKDAGDVLPGHGGLLDRVDALVVAVPLSYLYLWMSAA